MNKHPPLRQGDDPIAPGQGGGTIGDNQQNFVRAVFLNVLNTLTGSVQEGN